MKRLIMLSGVAVLALASCKNDKEPVPPVTPPPVESPAPPVAPKPVVKSNATTTTTTTTSTTEENPDGTSVSIGNGGVSIKSKNGTDENNVTINRKTTEIKVEKRQ
jgi:hypothetical protein